MNQSEKPKAIQDILEPPRFQDINYSAVERFAKAHLEGWKKYEEYRVPPGQKNYHFADLEFALGRLGNAIKHMLALKAMYEHILYKIPLPRSVDAREDHLGHAGANLNMLAKYEQMEILPRTDSLNNAIESRTFIEGQQTTLEYSKFWNQTSNEESKETEA